MLVESLGAKVADKRYSDLPEHVRKFIEGLDAEEVATIQTFVRWWGAASIIGKSLAWFTGILVAAALGAWGVLEGWLKFVATIKGIK